MVVQATSEEKQKRKQAFGFRLSKKQLEAGKKFFESLSQKRVEQTKKRIAAPPKAKEKIRKAKVTQRAKGLKGKGTPAGPTPESEEQIRKSRAEAELAESKADQGHLATEIAAQKTETATKIAETTRVKLGQAEEEAVQQSKSFGFDPIVGTPEDSSQRLDKNILDFSKLPDFDTPINPAGAEPKDFAAALQQRELVNLANPDAPGRAFTTPPGKQSLVNVLAKLRADSLLGQSSEQAEIQRATIIKELTGGELLSGSQFARIDREAVPQINLRAEGGFLGLGRRKQIRGALFSLRIAAGGTDIIAAADTERQRLARALKKSLNQMTPFEMLTQNQGKIEVKDVLVDIEAGIANTALTGLFEDGELVGSTFTSALYQTILNDEELALAALDSDDPELRIQERQIEATTDEKKRVAIDEVAEILVEEFNLTAGTAKEKAVEISKAVAKMFKGKEGLIARLRARGTSKNDLLILAGAIRWTEEATEYIRKLKDALIKFARVKDDRAIKERKEAVEAAAKGKTIFRGLFKSATGIDLRKVPPRLTEEERFKAFFRPTRATGFKSKIKKGRK